MTIRLKRVYDAPAASDGERILVERLWPRGLSKERAKVDLWAKNTAPSAALRTWFGHDPKRWKEFKKRYFVELDANPDGLDAIHDRLDEGGSVTFVFASRETRFNNAVALKAYLEASRS